MFIVKRDRYKFKAMLNWIVKIFSRSFRTNARAYWEIPGNVFNAIVGSLLTKNSVEQRGDRNNARQNISVKDGRERGFNLLWDYLESYCGTPPSTIKSSRNRFNLSSGSGTEILRFKTTFMSCFNRFHSLFYINGVKRVPTNIVDLMNAEVLAFWYLFSGLYQEKHVYFLTEHLLDEDVALLISALRKQDIVATRHPVRGSEGYRIYIGSQYVDRFFKQIDPYI